jgi:DNA processing protein
MNGITIISGGAFGVDYNSQQIALNHKGKVITVIASGIENPTPKTNADFFTQVIQNGLLISEYPGQTPASKFAFVKRNRIIAALANLVLIVEAKEKSGALSTAEFALEMGIPVACVPGRPTDELSKGTNNLIKSGAHLVQDYNDILSLLGCDSLNLFKRS